MPNRISEQQIAHYTRKWLDSSLAKEHPACQFYLFKSLTNRLKQVASAFPPSSMHTVAIKANPLPPLLQYIRKQGFAVEAASMGELQLALEAGFREDQIVFDSPIKTVKELQFALQNNILLNVDNFQELARIDSIWHPRHQSPVGIRVNPQVGAGSIVTTSVADHYSKFGIPLKEQDKQLLQAYRKHKWLKGIHIHIGSQGCSLHQLLKGLETVLLHLSSWRENYPELNKQLSFLDIGGGLPVSYHEDQEPPSMKKYADAIKLLLEKYRWQHLLLITEFGRYYHVNSGFSMSKVEYVKQYTTPKTAMMHLGADYFVRECLNPESWYHEVSVLDKLGNIKTKAYKAKYNLAGPLCFAGDIVIRNRQLPLIDPDDYVVIHDTGGYTFAMYSRYVSRQMPPIVGIEENEHMILLRPGESAAQASLFWQGNW